MFSPEDTLSAEEESFFAAYLAAAGGCTRAKQVSLLILCYGKGIASEYAALLRQYGPPGLSVAAVDVEMGKTQAEIIRQAIEIAGVLNRGGGIALTAERLMRCTPFSKGGFNPVKENYRGRVKWLI